VERVLELYRKRYIDLNVRHFHEKLSAEHAIELSYSWVKGVLRTRGERNRHQPDLRFRAIILVFFFSTGTHI
jgi:hypothetical protein